jgi:hypothetical protein
VWQTISYYSALAVQSLFGVFGVRLYEEPHYDVIERIGDQVEIRHYAPRLVAEVDLAVAGSAVYVPKSEQEISDPRRVHPLVRER